MKNQTGKTVKATHTTKDVQAAVLACEKVGIPLNHKAIIKALKEAK